MLSEQLWVDAESTYAAILRHPFITGLTDGTLAPEKFRHFIVQDAHYLRGFARALTVCAAKAPDEHVTVMFADHAAGAIRAEQEMHAELAEALGLDPRQLLESPVAPTTVAYRSYLLATVYGGSFAEGLGAVLPCYWIYARVGEALLEKSSPDPLYARWIAMYGGEEFQATVNDVLDVTNRVGAQLSASETANVREHFRVTARYEWMFWDAGYREETWPI
ncbi:MAG TPA: thiaminase II [Pseudonocardia sp.]|jgi:thiaminase/transcriptional activator TenA|nr:thiaminase II [Pseudonocardia sp.]